MRTVQVRSQQMLATPLNRVGLALRQSHRYTFFQQPVIINCVNLYFFVNPHSFIMNHLIQAGPIELYFVSFQQIMVSKSKWFLLLLFPPSDPSRGLYISVFRIQIHLDPHSIGHLDPDPYPHSECGSGSRRYKKN
jgi:hypothetical protein